MADTSQERNAPGPLPLTISILGALLAWAFRQVVWTKRGPRLHGESIGQAESSRYTCPSCGEGLFDKSGDCGEMTQTLLPYCSDCDRGKADSINVPEVLFVGFELLDPRLSVLAGFAALVPGNGDQRLMDTVGHVRGIAANVKHRIVAEP